MLRLPPSLVWLTDHRGRVDGEIQRIEKYFERHRRIFEKFKELNDELVHLKATMLAIDHTLSLHEVQIDPSNIPVIYSKKHRIQLPYGELTRLIYQRIRMGNGVPVSTREINDFVILRHPFLQENDAKEGVKYESKLSRRIHHRLKNLCREGKIERHHSKTSMQQGLWSLSTLLTQGIQNPSVALEHSL
ncbi:hypothetical protein ACTOWA_20765 [Herbaspirillum seropedicae]|uniref:hypothetical protein n=1 Tax=Herbaspirillum seropedicae TaxID=964 RepID=UPI003F8D4857